MKNNRIQSTPDDFLLSNNHLRLLDRIFISHHQQCNLNILKQQIIDWMAMVLSEERENWSELKEIWCKLYILWIRKLKRLNELKPEMKNMPLLEQNLSKPNTSNF